MFTVVIPLYNKEEYILETIESVLAQDFKSFELIIVNDGSTDKSLERVNSISDYRVKVINQKNSGVGAARNKGMSNANYNWIALLDGDDIWRPNHLSELKKIIESFPSSGLVSTQHLRFSHEEELCSKSHIQKPEIRSINYFAEAAKTPSIIWSSAACINKQVFNEIGGFSDQKLGEDLECWVKIALDYPVAISERVTSYYRQNTGGAIESFGRRKVCDFKSIGDVNAPFSLIEQRAINDPLLIKDPNIIKYINALLVGDVRASLYYDDISMAKQFAKLRIKDKSKDFMVLSLINVTPKVYINKTLKIYKRLNNM